MNAMRKVRKDAVLRRVASGAAEAWRLGYCLGLCYGKRNANRMGGEEIACSMGLIHHNKIRPVLRPNGFAGLL